MSLENVRAFYERLAQDETFRSELQELKNQGECSQFVQEAGYNFTKEEFENYTSELLESSLDEGELKDLNEREMELVFGGASGNKPLYPFPPFLRDLLPSNVPWPPKPFEPPIVPLYGVIISPE
ncbi:Nif11-like leader peptide family natural product precursor [Crocosphaera sp. XPORK-15E]|uniref:Nif11-like leader peptide family natural product precursor n=1 Tax=Crocosphaera sp. XPORK-15E TaxID=3110247 RepID=UPI002B1F7AFC|nr:Nif11-like leader peptide family natural product precursor [Crocosphaera sp. XPORK-15E]MEA5535813.1 Nif11-like leader peptide family natural product precursor [Crocosphaera sp. XPORK-15E]